MIDDQAETAAAEALTRATGAGSTRWTEGERLHDLFDAATALLEA